MAAPYQAIGLVPTMWGIRRREEIAKNLYLERAPYKHDAYGSEVLEPQIRKLTERGVYAPPEGGG